MNDLLREMQMAIADGLKNRTLTTCLRWAERRRMMGEPFAGPYTSKYHPWVREPHDSQAPFNYSMKGAQLGMTEVVINRAFYTLDMLKRDVLYVLPTSKNARDFSKSRFNTALRLSPYLKSLFTDTDSIELKQARASTLYIRGSKGDSNLKSIPASELILDELDEMEQSQVWLALERLSGQKVKRVWGISTPTIPNYGIHKLYQETTQEHFCFPCPSCSRWTHLVWPDCIEIVGEGVADPRVHESYLKCKECKAKLPQEAKPEWLASAKWVPQALNANPDNRGFHISQLYSFTISPGELVIAHFRGFGDELANKEFHNSKLGLPFIGDGAKVDDVMLDQCVRKHTKSGKRPTVGGERFITMGVDQGKWCYVVVKEWDIPRMAGDLIAASTPKVLWEQKFLDTDWQLLDELMREWQVLGCVIDADPEINEARRFARRYPGYVWLCRYRRGQTAKEISIADDEGCLMATVDRSNWLSSSLGRFKSNPPRILLPADISNEYREHVKNLVSTYVRDDEGNPRLDFVATGPDHFAHANNYADIALPLAAAHQANENIEAFL